MIVYLFCSVIFSFSIAQPQVGYVYESCTDNNNNLNFSSSVSGGTLYFTPSDRDSNLAGYRNMNNTIIVNCLVVLQGRRQNLFPYKIFFGIHFRKWEFVINTASRNNITIVDKYYPNATMVRSVCGSACLTGCMQLIHPKYSTVTTLCEGNVLTGTDYPDYFEENYVFLRFYLVGSIYFVQNQTVTEIAIFPPRISIIIDFYSFYFGQCVDSTTEFQCIYTDRCIDIILKCDVYGGMDCGVQRGGSAITYDQEICSIIPPIPQPNLLWLLLMLLIPILLFALIWLFYRPGICCWRCARLRNCPACRKACCIACCTLPCVQGNAPNRCICCRSTPYLTEFPNSNSKCALCCLLCCGKNPSSEGDNSLVKNKVSPYDLNVTDNKHDNSEWTKYSLGDGYHLRECR